MLICRDIFASETGGPLYYRNVSRRGLGKAVKDAKLAAPKPRFHDLRHTATRLLIAEGLNVVYIAQQMGHVDAGFTLRVYGHLFGRAEHASRANAALEARYGAMV